MAAVPPTESTTIASRTSVPLIPRVMDNDRQLSMIIDSCGLPHRTETVKRRERNLVEDLHSASASSAWLSCRVMWDRGDIVYPANPKASSCKCPDGCLGTGSGNSRPDTAYRANADMESVDPF